jgi:hypothetical protein
MTNSLQNKRLQYGILGSYSGGMLDFGFVGSETV